MSHNEQEARLAIVGPCPRLLIGTRLIPLQKLVDRYSSLARDVVSASDSLGRALRNGAYQDQSGFHQVFFILGPQHAENQLWLWFRPGIAPGSPFLLKVLQEELTKQDQASLGILLDALSFQPTVFGVVYEARLLKQLREGSLRKSLMFEDGSKDHLPTSFDILAPSLGAVGQMSSFNPQLTTFQPVSANFPTFDGVIATPERIFLLQVTVARRHAMKTAGLQRVIELAQQSCHRGDFVLVYVVPTEEHARSMIQAKASTNLLAHASRKQITLRVGAIVVPMGQYANVSLFLGWPQCD
jgi:hypothetical protein